MGGTSPLAPSSPVWTGNFNPRGIQMVYTNSSGVSSYYYIFLIDLPDTIGPQGSDISYLGFNYIPQSNNIQLNFQMNAVMPSTIPAAAMIQTVMMIYTPQDEFDPSEGANVSSVVLFDQNFICFCGGNPNQRQPPLKNLPLTTRHGGKAGIPITVIIQSASNNSQYFVVPMVNTDSEKYTNQLTVSADPANPTNLLVSTQVGGDGSMVVALGFIASANNQYATYNFSNPDGSNPQVIQIGDYNSNKFLTKF